MWHIDLSAVEAVAEAVAVAVPAELSQHEAVQRGQAQATQAGQHWKAA